MRGHPDQHRQRACRAARKRPVPRRRFSRSLSPPFASVFWQYVGARHRRFLPVACAYHRSRRYADPLRQMSSNLTVPPGRPLPRTTDKRMPVEDLPYPLGGRHADDPADDNRLYGLLGDQAVFEHIGLRPNIRTRAISEWQSVGGRLNGEMFAGLKKVFGLITEIEEGPMGSAASMTNDAEFNRFASWQWVASTDDDAHFFVFRSRDAEWAGFRWRGECFRFRLASLLGFVLETGMPARGSGYFQVSAVCVLRDEPGPNAWFRNVEAAHFDLSDAWTAEVAFELLSVLTRVANFLGKALTANQVADA
ncbi:hypothetical protein [Burkholderia ubonensis]|uniref:hypothetical protein n=1 Tax=Burkholderia ubonensis TaxID=101571 RepID=UPI000A80654D|nr:hypothetical protein [Burkholderia ubonensis]